MSKDKITREEMYPLLVKAANKMREEIKNNGKKK